MLTSRAGHRPTPMRGATENFWTDFFAPSLLRRGEGLQPNRRLPPRLDVPNFAFSVADLGGLVVLACREPENYTDTSSRRFRVLARLHSLRRALPPIALRSRSCPTGARTKTVVD
ncbi:hypothetical protein FKP32DRAFT_1598026 [Trametes sanguinea]|nr:hypothetical protein FKP32DRAFT_1598026 [Trametes sanguinea]